MKTINVVNFIPCGHENAITLDELAWQTDLDKRTIRGAIAKSKELVINLQDGKGYFKPAKDEHELVQEWIMIMGSRVRELSWRVRKAKKWLNG